MAYVYVVTHRESGRSYVGLTTRAPGWRWKEHREVSRRDPKFPFHRALAKYGVEAFDWCVVWDGPELQVKRLEQQLIRAGLGHFNCTTGGDGLTGMTHREETKQRMSESAKQRGQQPPPRVGTEASRNGPYGAGSKRPASWGQNISQAQRSRFGRQDETDEQRLERKREEARQYYRTNRVRILQQKETHRREAGVPSRQAGATCL